MTGVRGPYAKSAARRQQIISAACASFVEHGVAASSLRGIAARAGITHAGLLHHFSSKDELLVAVLEQRDLDERERSAAASPGGVLGRAPFLTRLLLEHQAAPELMRLWAELTASAARPGDPAHDYFVARYARARAAMAHHLRRRAAAGALREGLDPEHAAALLAAVLDGLQTQWLLDHDRDIVEPLDQFLALLLRPGASWSGDEPSTS